MPSKLYITAFLLIANCLLAEAKDILKDFQPEFGREYIVRLTNGDIISGEYDSFVSDPEDGDAIKLRTDIGTALIYGDQIVEINIEEDYYRHKHRVFVLPTAEPISNDHFIGDFELLFLYCGIGIGDWVSITAGRSVLPSIPAKHQISDINLKTTLMNSYFGDANRKISLALGANIAFLNHNNKIMHLYGTGTMRLSRTSITASIFGKVSGGDFYDIKFGYNNDIYGLTFHDGAIGIGLGIDTKFSRKHNLHFIGELWNSNITKPTNTGVLLGFRICDTDVSADFGLAFFTQPLAVPFVSFAWTPF